jgi:metal-sulfur cluster biosynthetic enzyme
MHKKQVLDALRKVIHPEMKRNLVELGMIHDVILKDDHVVVTFALPFKEVPIKDDLVNGVQNALTALDPTLETTVKLVEMSQPERAAFLAQAEGGSNERQLGRSFGKPCVSSKSEVGLDLSTAMLTKAKALDSPPLIQGNALRLPLADDAFDVMILITTLEFLAQPRQALAEASRIARYGIINLIRVPVSLNPAPEGSRQRIP